MSIPTVNIGDISVAKEYLKQEDFGSLKLVDALKKYGLVLVKDHGIPSAIIEEALEASRKFFGMPLEEKMKFAIGKDHMHGYVELGSETLNIQDRVCTVRKP